MLLTADVTLFASSDSAVIAVPLAELNGSAACIVGGSSFMPDPSMPAELPDILRSFAHVRAAKAAAAAVRDARLHNERLRLCGACTVTAAVPDVLGAQLQLAEWQKSDSHLFVSRGPALISFISSTLPSETNCTRATALGNPLVPGHNVSTEEVRDSLCDGFDMVLSAAATGTVTDSTLHEIASTFAGVAVAAIAKDDPAGYVHRLACSLRSWYGASPTFICDPKCVGRRCHSHSLSDALDQGTFPPIPPDATESHDFGPCLDLSLVRSGTLAPLVLVPRKLDADGVPVYAFGPNGSALGTWCKPQAKRLNEAADKLLSKTGLGQAHMVQIGRTRDRGIIIVAACTCGPDLLTWVRAIDACGAQMVVAEHIEQGLAAGHSIAAAEGVQVGARETPLAGVNSTVMHDMSGATLSPTDADTQWKHLCDMDASACNLLHARRSWPTTPTTAHSSL